MHTGENEARTSERADALVQEKVKRKWQTYIWDTLDKSPEERRFLFKLDFALLTFASLGKWTEDIKSSGRVADFRRLLYQVP